jgi:hypothetical protein
MKKSALILILLVLVGVMAASVALCNSRTEDPLGVAVSPQLLLKGVPQGGEVTVHTASPYGAVLKVKALLTLNGVPAQGWKADSRGNIVIFFDEVAVEDTVEAPGATLLLAGQLIDGTPFSGTDGVRVR